MPIYNMSNMCSTPVDFLFDFFTNKTPAWFTPAMAEFLVNDELEKHGINRTACLLYKKTVVNAMEATYPIFKSLHFAMGGFGALLFTGCCISQMKEKNYLQATIAAAGALTFVAATFASSEAAPRMMTASLTHLLIPYCPFDPFES